MPGQHMLIVETAHIPHSELRSPMTVSRFLRSKATRTKDQEGSRSHRAISVHVLGLPYVKADDSPARVSQHSNDVQNEQKAIPKHLASRKTPRPAIWDISIMLFSDPVAVTAHTGIKSPDDAILAYMRKTIITCEQKASWSHQTLPKDRQASHHPLIHKKQRSHKKWRYSHLQPGTNQHSRVPRIHAVLHSRTRRHSPARELKPTRLRRPRRPEKDKEIHPGREGISRNGPRGRPPTCSGRMQPRCTDQEFISTRSTTSIDRLTHLLNMSALRPSCYSFDRRLARFVRLNQLVSCLTQVVRNREENIPECGRNFFT